MGKHSLDFVAPILVEKNDGCDQYRPFSTGIMELYSMRLKGASNYGGYMEIQNLKREGTPAQFVPEKQKGNGIPNLPVRTGGD